MGVTIHYRGSLNNKKYIDKFIVEMSDICDSMNWKYEVLDEDWTVPSSLQIEHQEDGVTLKGHAGLKGVSFIPHEDCEPVRLTFDAKGQLNTVMNLAFGIQKSKSGAPWIFSKTQFAGAEVHISIIKLLKYIHKKYVSNLEVRDEGNYWETGDETNVNSRMNMINNAMSALEEGLRELGNLEDLTEDGIIKKIEEVIENLGDQEGMQVKVMRIDSVLKKFEEEMEAWEKSGEHSELLDFFKNMPSNPEEIFEDFEDQQTINFTNDELAEIIAFDSADDEFSKGNVILNRFNESDDYGIDDDDLDDWDDDDLDNLEDLDDWEDDFLDGFEGGDDPDLTNPSLN